ncbi:hypothetical protein [Nesterenkonia ebinurensis]|uniref:hypothetical protein n=1 Tax=Nesterenkonia ebinurensis TaxID=2608252 RepID=UPI00123CBF22|nr:hypothetical protein [Nesterenkonia ebinurensis]
MAEAETFMEEGRADVMLIAYSWPDENWAPQECTGERDYDYSVECFRPEPLTTQGEAISLRDYASEQGWDSVAVMTVDHHVTRSRMIINRCFDGELHMIGVEAEGYWGGPVRTYLYQNAGIARTLLSSGCEGEPPDWIQDSGDSLKDRLLE